MQRNLASELVNMVESYVEHTHTHFNYHNVNLYSIGKIMKEKKGKEEYLYSTFIQLLVSKSSDMDHTVLPANYTMPAFPL